MFDLMFTAGLGAFAMLFIPVLTYFHEESQHRGAWVPLPGPRVRLGGDGYRGTEIPGPMSAGRAPWLVRATAFTCLLAGQMFLPGLVAGLLGLMVFGAGIVSVPGLIVAWRTFGVGRALLQRTDGVARRARTLANHTILLNVVVLLVSACLAASRDLHAIAAMVTAYAVGSLGLSACLHRTATLIDREDRALESASANGVRVSMTPYVTAAPVEPREPREPTVPDATASIAHDPT